jgi:hypothetical protein
MKLMSKIRNRVIYQVLRRGPDEESLIFGIGLARTGTKSLCLALDSQGIRALHYPPMLKPSGDDFVFYWPWWMSTFQAFADVPVSYNYQELKHRFPKAKFILTTRDKEQWLDSCRRHFTEERHRQAMQNPQWVSAQKLNFKLYGSHVYDYEKFSDRYDSYHARIRTDFADQPNFLEMDICKGDHWQVLCPFLNIPVPDTAFPRSNTGPQ